jgi:hypothetical protein
MRRQRGPGRVAALPRLRRRVGVGMGVWVGRGPRLRLGSVFLEVTDQQFELFDLAVELLRGAAEARAAQHGQLRLELLDVQGLGVDLGRVGRDLDLLALRASSACRLAANCRSSSGSIGSGSLARDMMPETAWVGRSRTSIFCLCSDRQWSWHRLRRNRPAPIDRLDQ